MTSAQRLFRRILCHNDNHYIPLEMGGEMYPLCTRCTGMFAGFLLSIGPIILLGAYRAPGTRVALAGIALCLPDYLYWALTRINLLPDHTGLRVLTGFLLGIGIVLFGQANLAWLVKFLVAAVMFLPAVLLDPVLGRSRGASPGSGAPRRPELNTTKREAVRAKRGRQS